MKHHPISLAALLFAILLFAGNCRKSEISFESTNVSFSVSGRVLDKDNVPVSQAEVKAGSSTTITDVDGYFRLNNVRMPKDAAYVKVEKNGYFAGSRTFSANTGAVNFVSIRLIPKDITGTFQSAGGGLVDLTSGGSINFQANSIVDANTNNAYSGTVSVSSFFIDPTVADFTSIMPGDLRGITTSNDERGLQSFGMMAVELIGSGGQKLQIASGKNATISFPIPVGLQSHAPASIPLWYFDETNGLWKEEGSAAKQGNMYVGTVSHFSFWNCDAPFPLVNFEARVKDQNGNPVANAEVVIKKVSDSSMACGRTDSAGKVSGKIPANQPLILRIYDRCHTLIHSQNIGPFAGNANLGVITVTVQPLSMATITGSVVTCSNTPVMNGYVNVHLDGMNYRANINNGNFSINIQRCNNSATQAHLIAVDLANNQQSAATTIMVTTGNINVGQLSACGVTATQFINYTIDANSFGFLAPADSLLCYRSDSASTAGGTTVMGMGGNEDIFINFSGPAATGAHPLVFARITHGNTLYQNSQTTNVNITEYGAPGGFVAGTMTGVVIKNNTTTHNFTCSFRVRRDF